MRIALTHGDGDDNTRVQCQRANYKNCRCKTIAIGAQAGRKGTDGVAKIAPGGRQRR